MGGITSVFPIAQSSSEQQTRHAYPRPRNHGVSRCEHHPDRWRCAGSGKRLAFEHECVWCRHRPHESAVSQTKSDKQSGEERVGWVQMLERFAELTSRLAKRFSGYERLPTAETNAASPVFEDWVTKYGVDSLYPGSIMMTMNIP